MLPPPELLRALGDASAILKPLFSIAALIFDVAETVYVNKAQLKALGVCVESHLRLLDNEDPKVSAIVEAADFMRVQLGEIEKFVNTCRMRKLPLQIVFYSDTAKTIARHFDCISRNAQLRQLNYQSVALQTVVDLRDSLKEDKAQLSKVLTSNYNRHDSLADALKVKLSATSDTMERIRSTMINDNIATRDTLNEVLDSLQLRNGSKYPLKANLIPRSDVIAGKCLGKYESYDIYEGEWTGAAIAIKEFHNTVSPDRFQKEMLNWSNLHHPNILVLYGICDQKLPCLAVMPLCAHGNVISYLQCKPEANRSKLITDVAAGLAYLHKKNVIHGELRASNILVDELGKAQISDFYLSHLRLGSLSANEDTNVTLPARWMSPERLQRGTINLPADIYAFGLTVYEIYAMEIPWKGYDDEMVKGLINDGQHPRIPENAAMDLEVRRLIDSCFVKEPAKRPLASELFRQLQHWLVLERSRNTPSPIPSDQSESSNPSSSQVSSQVITPSSSHEALNTATNTTHHNINGSLSLDKAQPFGTLILQLVDQLQAMGMQDRVQEVLELAKDVDARKAEFMSRTAK